MKTRRAIPVLTLTLLGAFGPRGRRSPCFGQAMKPRAHLADQGGDIFAGTVVDHNDLEIEIFLLADRLQRFPQRA